MKHAVIVGHPNEDSFTQSVARTYRDAIEAHGELAIVRDLYRMAFDPRLQGHEIPRRDYATGSDVVAERALLADADVFVFVYPLWFNAPPAIVVGYIQRVFGLGFGYEAGLTGNRPLLTGRKFVGFTSSGAPTEWLQKEGGWDALRALFDVHFAAICGLQVAEHMHFGHVTPATPKNAVTNMLAQVSVAANRVAEIVSVD